MIATAVIIGSSLGCIQTERNDWSTYTGPGAAYFQEPEFELKLDEDPLEPVNRLFSGMNHAAVIWLVDPVSTGWRFMVPQDARDSLVNASRNIEYPRRAVNNLLQGKAKEAGDESARFLINSTVGGLGLFDPAKEEGLQPANTDTGTTLTQWGWRDSTYTTFPFGNPGTVRDLTGTVGDTLLDPTVYFFPAAPAKGFIVGSERIADYKRLLVTNMDPYQPLRMMWLTNRRIFDEVYTYPPDQSGPAQTMRYAYLSFEDPWFPYAAKNCRVKLTSTKRHLPYDLWMQDQPSSIVFLVPGFGSHRQSKQTIALAETLYAAGYSVATVSNPANFEFMQNAATVHVPGFAPTDAADLHAALDAVWYDIARKHASTITDRCVIGLSLGGSLVMHLAAAAQSDAFIDFDAYVSIGGPVQLRHAVEQVDAFFNTPLAFPEEEREPRVQQILQKGVKLGFAGSAVADRVGFSETEAKFLVGVSYRLALHDAIWLSQQRHDMDVLKTRRCALQRRPASQEILDFSFMEYAYAFMLKYMDAHGHGVTNADELFAAADLRSIESALRSNRRAGAVCNENDFVTTTDDLAWLGSALGPDRLVVHPDGGHLGNLDDATVRQSLLDLLRRLRGVDVAPIDNAM